VIYGEDCRVVHCDIYKESTRERVTSARHKGMNTAYYGGYNSMRRMMTQRVKKDMVWCKAHIYLIDPHKAILVGLLVVDSARHPNCHRHRRTVICRGVRKHLQHSTPLVLYGCSMANVRRRCTNRQAPQEYQEHAYTLWGGVVLVFVYLQAWVGLGKWESQHHVGILR
jgi:hypothetical protein